MPHLLAFTLASPLTCIGIFAGLSFFSQSKDLDKDTMSYLLGELLLLSAGTFLYVSLLHILPEALKAEAEEVDD